MHGVGIHCRYRRASRTWAYASSRLIRNWPLNVGFASGKRIDDARDKDGHSLLQLAQLGLFGQHLPAIAFKLPTMAHGLPDYALR